MAGLISEGWEFFTSNLGGLALLVIAGGVAMGMVRSVWEKFGAMPVMVMLTVGGIAVAWAAVCYTARHPEAQMREAQAQPVAVKQSIPARAQQKARPHRRRIYVQYPSF